MNSVEAGRHERVVHNDTELGGGSIVELQRHEKGPNSSETHRPNQEGLVRHSSMPGGHGTEQKPSGINVYLSSRIDGAIEVLKRSKQKKQAIMETIFVA